MASNVRHDDTAYVNFLVMVTLYYFLVECSFGFFFFSSRRRHTRYWRDWSSDVCSSDLAASRPCRRCVTGVPYCPGHGGAAAQNGPGGWRVLRGPALARGLLVGVGLLPAHGEPGDTGRRGDRRRRGGGAALGAGLAARRVAGGRVDEGPPRAAVRRRDPVDPRRPDRALRRGPQRPGGHRPGAGVRRRLRVRPDGRRGRADRVIEAHRHRRHGVGGRGGVAVPHRHGGPPYGGTLIVGETLGNRYTAFDLGDDGTLTNRRVWAPLGPEVTGRTTEEVLGQLTVAPDGCTMDAEGHVWAADAVGGRVVRVAQGGAIVDEVAAPQGLGVFACMLGGEDGRTLLMCCAPDFYEHNRAPVREAVLEIGRAHV